MQVSIETTDVLLRNITLMILSILLIGICLKKLHQPYFIAYIIAGVILGPFITGIFSNADTIRNIGDLGLIMEMFFIGLCLKFNEFKKHIKSAVFGTLSQFIFTFLFTALIGFYLKWTLIQTSIFAFIISISSTAIIQEYLRKTNENNTKLGLLVKGILIMQDFIIIPVLMIINLTGRNKLENYHLILGFVGMLLFIMLLIKLLNKKQINIPLMSYVSNDHTIQIFAGLLICFGSAWIASSINLTASIGAMVGGLIIGHSGDTNWLEKNLEPFRIFFIALFFFSIGLIIDFRYLENHISLVLLVTTVVLVVNAIINMLVFRLFKESWSNSFYAGALLSQIGEFSLVICLTANGLNLINKDWYQLTISVLCFTMLFSTIWIGVIRAFIFPQESNMRKILRFATIQFNKNKSKPPKKAAYR